MHNNNYWDDDKVFFLFVGFSIAFAALLVGVTMLSVL